MPRFLKSTIFLKMIMAITGLAICGFIGIHAVGNFQYWLSPDTYNTYAALLQGLGELLWVARAGLLVCVILHIISAVYLRIYSNQAKPTGYQVKNYMKAKINSRTMLWTGLLIACGITFHILHFTAGALSFENGYNQDEIAPTEQYVIGSGIEDCPMKSTMYEASSGCHEENGVISMTVQGDCREKESKINIYERAKPGQVVKPRHDVFGMVQTEFSNPIAMFIYCLFVGLIAFHLSHAIQSGLHTLGIQGRRFTPIMRIVSIVFAVLIFGALCILPVGIYSMNVFGINFGGLL